MIDKKQILKLINEKLSSDMFLVEVTISKKNIIHVFIDGYNGITIDDCVDISRYIESNLDRDTEDFELQVSSAGLGQPFKVVEQYHKNQGKEVEVILLDGQKINGNLTDIIEDGIKIKFKKKIKVEGKKKKKAETLEKRIGFDQIKETKTIISFK